MRTLGVAILTTEAISLEKAKSEARFFAIASAILLALVLLIPSRVLAVFLIIPLAYTGWLVLLHGTTAVSMTLQGSQRTAFQVATALVVPLVLSLFFLQRTENLTVYGLFGHMLSPWYLLPFGFIGYVSWHAGTQLDREQPFRGFLIAGAVLFVICVLGYYGIYSEFDEQTETSLSYIDKEAATLAAQTGRYFGQFLAYVLVAYAGLFAKLRTRHT